MRTMRAPGHNNPLPPVKIERTLGAVSKLLGGQSTDHTGRLMTRDVAVILVAAGRGVECSGQVALTGRLLDIDAERINEEAVGGGALIRQVDGDVGIGRDR